MECIVCDQWIDKAVAFFLWYPFCSQKCVDEWNELTYEEQQRYMQCMQYLYTEACC